MLVLAVRNTSTIRTSHGVEQPPGSPDRHRSPAGDDLHVLAVASVLMGVVGSPVAQAVALAEGSVRTAGSHTTVVVQA